MKVWDLEGKRELHTLELEGSSQVSVIAASCTETRSTRKYADLACRVMARLNRPIGAQPTSRESSMAA